MSDQRYDEGDLVPEEVCSVPSAWGFVRFAVGVDISQGYGRSKHIYPTEEIEDTTDLFTVGEETIQRILAEEVHLYTTPRQMLR